MRCRNFLHDFPPTNEELQIMNSIYFFGNGKADGCASDNNLLGGKGANLAEMTSLGIPVPPGFTISTDVCTYYMDSDNYPDKLKSQAENALKKIEKIMD